MSRFGPNETLDAHITAQAAAAFKEGDLIDFEGRQYKVAVYLPQPDGTVKVTLAPTGADANFVPPRPN
jgi:hypothetical protein